VAEEEVVAAVVVVAGGATEEEEEGTTTAASAASILNFAEVTLVEPAVTKYVLRVSRSSGRVKSADPGPS
jgi:hypothetical protein